MSIRDSRGKLYFKKRRRAKSAEYENIYDHRTQHNDDRRSHKEFRGALKRRKVRDLERRT